MRELECIIEDLEILLECKSAGRKFELFRIDELSKSRRRVEKQQPTTPL